MSLTSLQEVAGVEGHLYTRLMLLHTSLGTSLGVEWKEVSRRRPQATRMSA